MSIDEKIDLAEFEKIPADFPRPVHIGSVSGTQPKFLVTLYHGRYYEPGTTPPEIHQRWNICSDIVKQLVPKALESKGGKRSHMAEAEILKQYQKRLLATNWVSVAEANWVMREVALVLNWSFES